MTTPTFEIFFANANDASKRFSLETFSFTHQCGLNVYFDDYEDFKEICKDVELEFWHLVDSISDAELDVSSFAVLEQLIDFLYGLDSDNYDKVEHYGALIKGGYVLNWSDVENYYSNNFVVDFENDVDFGHFLIDELDCLELPDYVREYFDFERYGKDMVQHSYNLVNGKVYHQA